MSASYHVVMNRSQWQCSLFIWIYTSCNTGCGHFRNIRVLQHNMKLTELPY